MPFRVDSSDEYQERICLEIPACSEMPGKWNAKTGGTSMRSDGAGVVTHLVDDRCHRCVSISHSEEIESTPAFVGAVGVHTYSEVRARPENAAAPVHGRSTPDS